MRPARRVAVVATVAAFVLTGCDGGGDGGSDDPTEAATPEPTTSELACESWAELRSLDQQLEAGEIKARVYVIDRLEVGQTVSNTFDAAANEGSAVGDLKPEALAYVTAMATALTDAQAEGADQVDAACAEL